MSKGGWKSKLSNKRSWKNVKLHKRNYVKYANNVRKWDSKISNLASKLKEDITKAQKKEINQRMKKLRLTKQYYDFMRGRVKDKFKIDVDSYSDQIVRNSEAEDYHKWIKKRRR